MEKFGERIRMLRKQADLTQSELADKIGTSYIQIGRYETKGAVPSADMLKKIAEALNTDANFLLYGKTKTTDEVTIQNQKLLALFKQVEKLPPDDKKVIEILIDAMVTKHRIKKIMTDGKQLNF